MKIYSSTMNLWDMVRTTINKEAQSHRNPLRSPSFFTTNAGYYLEQAMMDVEERRGVVASYAGEYERFYDIDNPEAIVCETDRASFCDTVLDIVLDSPTREAFEREYNDYLWDMIDY